MRDSGEPISRGALDRGAAEVRALRDALVFAAFFTGAVLVNGIMAILVIALMQGIGWWEVAASADWPETMTELSGRLASRRAAWH